MLTYYEWLNSPKDRDKHIDESLLYELYGTNVKFNRYCIYTHIYPERKERIIAKRKMRLEIAALKNAIPATTIITKKVNKI